MRQCSRELAPIAQLVRCLAVWTSSTPVHHRHEVCHKPGQDWMSSWKLLSTASDEGSQDRSHGIFHILHSALGQSVAARLSSALTLKPANFNAVAADSFGAEIAGSLSDENLCEATANHVVLEFSNRILFCTLRWHNGCTNPAITVAFAHLNQGSRQLLRRIVTFFQVTVVKGNRLNRGLHFLHDVDAFGHVRCNTRDSRF